ncbi:MAG: hypothetical protein D6744_17035, partial [Planctomycetota bacterium]
MVATWASFAILALMQAAPADGRPQALRNALRARERLRTARIEFVRSERDPRLDGGECVQFFTWRCAGDAMIQEFRGMDDGRYVIGPNGRPVPDILNRPQNFLVDDARVWHHADDSQYARLYDRSSRSAYGLHDLRRLGVGMGAGDEDLETRLAANNLPPPVYSTRTEDGLTVVHASFDGGAVEWAIDPERGWNVVRYRAFVGDELVGEIRYRLHYFEHDGV